MSGLQQVVAKFLAEREQVITAINNCPASNMEDYWRWQGNAEARRVLREDLERDGIDLTAEPAPVASPESLVEHQRHRSPEAGCAWCPVPTAVFRAEATVKAEAIREAAQAQRQYAADARTNNGQAEHEDFADWLDDRAFAIDPAVVEGAHP